jgi:hypothetical protein
MCNKIDLTGKRFGRLVVLNFDKEKRRDNYKYYWICKCDCGNIKSICGGSLKNGLSKSCGCLQKLNAKKRCKYRNYKHGFFGTKFYTIWAALIGRCRNIKNKDYKNYGGRGITYDPQWKEFINFKNDMYFKYIYAKKLYGEKCLSIEREDVNGNYEFNNCIFIPKPDQNKNRRMNKQFEAISPDGKKYFSKTQNGFARQNNLLVNGINLCLRKVYKQYNGWRFNYV